MICSMNRLLRIGLAARVSADATDARIYAESARLTGEVTRQYYAALRAGAERRRKAND